MSALYGLDGDESLRPDRVDAYGMTSSSHLAAIDSGGMPTLEMRTLLGDSHWVVSWKSTIRKATPN